MLFSVTRVILQLQQLYTYSTNINGGRLIVQGEQQGCQAAHVYVMEFCYSQPARTSALGLLLARHPVDLEKQLLPQPCCWDMHLQVCLHGQTRRTRMAGCTPRPSCSVR